MHACPGPLCRGKAEVPAEQLMCGRDWAALKEGARPVARALWSTWAYGRGAGTPAHQAAMQAAIRTARRLANG